MSDAQSLKIGNLRWLASMAAVDMAVIAIFVASAISGASTNFEYLTKGVLVILLPVLVSAITDSVPHNAKARLVYWRWKHPLPGCRAFSQYCGRSGEIDVASLTKNIGAFPSDASQQGHRWYELYHLVRDRANVRETHRKYLRYRDLTAMSVCLLVIAPLLLWVFLKINVTGITVFFLAQTLWAIWLCRIAGDRFVSIVLMIHSVESVPGVVKAVPSTVSDAVPDMGRG